MATAPDGNVVVISGRALMLLTDAARLRRLRVAYCADDALHRDLLAITAIVLGAADGTKVAVPAPGRDAGVMTVGEFAAAAGIRARAVRRGCSEGRITASKRAGVWLIPVSELVRRRAAC